MVLSSEVAAALAAGRPVVALESTIISHGMPYPQNLATAQAVEGVVRAHGAVPATIAVLGGVPHAGLTPPQLEQLARGGAAVRKVRSPTLHRRQSCLPAVPPQLAPRRCLNPPCWHCPVLA